MLAHSLKRKQSTLGRLSTCFMIAVFGHILLFLHIIICSHKSEAIPNLSSNVLNFSIAEIIEGGSQAINSSLNSIAPTLTSQLDKRGGGNSTIKPIITSPRFLKYSPPIYPKAAIQQRLEGVVVVDIALDRLGNKEGTSVFSSSGYNILDNAALKAANLSTYSQLEEKDQPQGYIARIRYDFVLNK